MSVELYLALGSNLGDRAANLRAAWDGLPPAVQPLAASPVYETPPWGYIDQPAFLNQVIRGATQLAPAGLLDAVKRLESALGRQPTFRNGPRQIDIDLLFYGDTVLSLPGLTIPHPRLAERAFVLVPLADLAPGLVHPVLGRTMADLLASIDAGGIQLYTAP
jgi:2-amino-4-hydroxy-6-hydroxymethyldihydropteridine diphosphokinase